VSRWYGLRDRTPFLLATLEDQLTEWQRREDSLARGEDVYRVGRTVIGDNVVVSTVFLGLDHQWHPDGPPMLFETMVFTADESEADWVPDTERWSTWEQAEDQHEATVRETQRRLRILLEQMKATGFIS